MKFWTHILLLIIFLLVGNPIRNKLIKQFEVNIKNSNFSQISKSISNSPDVSIWGSSTAYMNFNAQLVQNELKLSCYNYGLSGAFFNQLQHLFSFTKINENKLIIWIVNPYEFKIDVESKLNQETYFTPFLQKLRGKKSFSKITQQNIGWNHLFHFNAEHWYLCCNKTVKSEFNAFGGHFVESKFQNINNYYKKSHENFSAKKIDQFKHLILEISQKNELVIIIPPNLENVDFSMFKSYLNTPIFDYSNLYSNKKYFHDHIHLNKNETKKLTKQFCKDLKILNSSKNLKLNFEF